MILTSRSQIMAALLGCDQVKLLDENNDFASSLTVREAQVITGFDHIEAHMYKGRLVHIRLKRGVKLSVALRRLTPLQVAASNRITKRRQGSGSKNWVPHFEKSEGGLVASHRRIVSPIAHPHRRYAVGKAEQPQEQFA